MGTTTQAKEFYYRLQFSLKTYIKTKLLITFFNLIRFIYKKVVDLNIIKNKQKLKTMKTKIQNEMKELYLAMKNKSLSVNDYSTMYYYLAQKLKAIK